MTFLDVPGADRVAIAVGWQRIELARACVDTIAIGKFRCPDSPFYCHDRSSSLVALRFRDFVLIMCNQGHREKRFQDSQSTRYPSAISIFARVVREVQSPLKDHVCRRPFDAPELRIEARGSIVVPRTTGIGAHRFRSRNVIRVWELIFIRAPLGCPTPGSLAMPDLSIYFTFIAAVLAMQAVPGPETILVVSQGLGQGRRVALFTV